MQFANIGSSNIKACEIILGTWQATDMWADIDDREISKAIRGALDVGNTFDTAPFMAPYTLNV